MAFGYGTNSRPYSINSQKVANPDFYNGVTNTSQLYYDPLITGYSIMIFTRFPSWVKRTFPNAPILLQKNFAGFDGNNDIELTTADVQEGFSQNAYQVAQSIGAKSNDFSTKHLEYSGSIISQIYTFWVTGIRDPDTGIATYPQQFGLDYCAYNHTAEIMYMSLRPDANNINRPIIEFASYWTACFPKKIPMSHFNYTKASQTAPVEIDMTWSGVQHIGPGVDMAAQKLLRKYNGGRSFNILQGSDFSWAGSIQSVLGGYHSAPNAAMKDDYAAKEAMGHQWTNASVQGRIEDSAYTV